MVDRRLEGEPLQYILGGYGSISPETFLVVPETANRSLSRVGLSLVSCNWLMT
jgi:hypothetical protein